MIHQVSTALLILFTAMSFAGASEQPDKSPIHQLADVLKNDLPDGWEIKQYPFLKNEIALRFGTPLDRTKPFIVINLAYGEARSWRNGTRLLDTDDQPFLMKVSVKNPTYKPEYAKLAEKHWPKYQEAITKACAKIKIAAPNKAPVEDPWAKVSTKGWTIHRYQTTKQSFRPSDSIEAFINNARANMKLIDSENGSFPNRPQMWKMQVNAADDKDWMQINRDKQVDIILRGETKFIDENQKLLSNERSLTGKRANDGWETLPAWVDAEFTFKSQDQYAAVKKVIDQRLVKTGHGTSRDDATGLSISTDEYFPTRLASDQQVHLTHYHGKGDKKYTRTIRILGTSAFVAQRAKWVNDALAPNQIKKP